MNNYWIDQKEENKGTTISELVTYYTVDVSKYEINEYKPATTTQLFTVEGYKHDYTMYSVPENEQDYFLTFAARNTKNLKYIKQDDDLFNIVTRSEESELEEMPLEYIGEEEVGPKLISSDNRNQKWIVPVEMVEKFIETLPWYAKYQLSYVPNYFGCWTIEVSE